MKIFGITGSLASGKTTASRILSKKKGPLFSADIFVKNLYRNKNFKKLIKKKFNINENSNFKNILKNKILENRSLIQTLEKIIHPLVRKEMRKFIKKNRNKKYIFLEIPLLIESKLMKIFDVIIFVKAKKSIRLKRFKSKGGSSKIFQILNNRQIKDTKKIKFCDHVVVNEKNLEFLRENLLDILKSYE